MKRFLVTFAVMALFAGTAVAQELTDPIEFDGDNEIGLYTTMTPTVFGDAYIDTPGGGQYFCYLLLSNATDENTGLPIATVGGYEMSFVVPAGWQFVTTLPAGTTDFDGAALHYYVSGTIPVAADGFCLLAEITVQSFGGDNGGIFVGPYSNGTPSIPGHMAITNADDNFTLSTAYPISGSYEDPIMGINQLVVDTEDVSWGGVKSLFK